EGFPHHRWRWQPTWFLEVTPVAVAGGDLRLAAQLADDARQLASHSPGVLTNAGVAALVHGLVHDDLDGIARGAALLRDSARPELGQRLLRDGQRGRAVTILEQAWEGFTLMGAAGRAEAARNLLHRS